MEDLETRAQDTNLLERLADYADRNGGLPETTGELVNDLLSRLSGSLAATYEARLRASLGIDQRDGIPKR